MKGKPILKSETLKNAVRRFTGDMTFEEIYDINKWNLNITVTSGSQWGECRLLNYLTSPNVVVWSAVVASCSIPFFLESGELLIKTEKGIIMPYYTHLPG